MKKFKNVSFILAIIACIFMLFSCTGKNSYSSLSKKVMNQFRQDMDDAYYYKYFKNIDGFTGFGIYDGWVVIGFFSESDVLPSPITVNELEVYLYHNMHAWKQNVNPDYYNFYPLQEVFDMGLLNKEDLLKIHEDFLKTTQGD